MERIKTLLETFNASEKKFLRTYLTAFHGKGENKAVELLDLVMNDKQITQDQASEILYGDPKTKAFIMLKSRLYEKMLESMMLSSNPSNTEKEMGKEPGFERIELRKLLIYNFLLKRKGLLHMAEELCEKGVKMSREYEYPDNELDFLGALRVYHATNQSEKYDQVIREMDEAFERFRLEMLSYNNWNNYRKMHAMRSSTEEARVYLEEALPRFEEDVAKLGTAAARYYLYLLKINYYSITREWDKCREQIMELLRVVKKSKRLNNLHGVGVVYVHLSMLELNCHRLDAALEAADQAAKFNKKNSQNNMIGLIIRSYILIHKGDIAKALRQINELETDITHEIFSFNWALCNYLRACIAFIKGDFSNSWKLLQDVSGLNFDRAGWITGIRIMEIMVLIERKEFDLIGLRLDSLRKHIQKHQAEERANVIHKILSAMEKEGFAFKSFRKEADYLEQLATEFPWTIGAHETLRFDMWYKFKRGIGDVKKEDIYVVRA